jgi:integrase
MGADAYSEDRQIAPALGKVQEEELDSCRAAGERMKGKQPYWPDNLMKRYIKPVARKAGINKNIGWHTFRHSFGTLLKANGEDVKTVQELLRHANSRITLDVYTQAVNSHKRAAQSKVVRMMVPNVGQREVETDSLLAPRRA